MSGNVAWQDTPWLSAIVAFMRAHGVVHLEHRNTVLTLGPEPPKHVEARPMTDEEILAKAKEEKAAYEALLFASSEGTIR